MMQSSAARLVRRLFPLVFVIPVLIVSTHGATRAQVGPPTPAPTSTPTPTPVPSVDPTHFALSLWEFPPPAVQVNARVESTAQADSEADIEHFGPSFAAEGRLTGYLMTNGTANFDKKGKQHPVFTYYLTSTFGSADAATAAFNQQKSGWDGEVTVPPTGLTVQQVPLSVTAGDVNSGGLYLETGQTTSGDVLDRAELFFKRGIYLVEIFQENLHADAKYATAERPYLVHIAKELDSVASGAIAGPPPPTIPSKPALHIISTRFEQNQLKLDFAYDLGRKPLTRVAAGTAIQASTYFEVTAARPNSHFTVHIKITRGSTSLSKTYTYPLGSYPPGYYRQDLYNLVLRVAGRYKMTTRVSIGKVSQTGTATVTVTAHAAVSARLRSAAQSILARPLSGLHVWALKR